MLLIYGPLHTISRRMTEHQQGQVGKLRLWATMALVVCYIVPLVVLTLYNVSVIPLDRAWGVLSLGLLGTMLGSSVLFVLLRQWEAAIVIVPVPDPVVLAPLAPMELEQSVMTQEIERLNEALMVSLKQSESLGEELHVLQRNLDSTHREKIELELQCEQAQQAVTIQQGTSEEQMRGKERLLEEYQTTITDQRLVIEKKQQHIVTLEGEIQDLKYELKTLVDLSDPIDDEGSEVELAPPPLMPMPKFAEPILRLNKTSEPLELGLAVPSRTTEEAQQQLKRCIDIAQKLTGARHLAGDSSRFRDLSADGYALDLRRLCDSLASEQSGTIVLYSQRDNKVLFVNNQVRGMLGWSPDKFLQNFANLFTDGLKEWKSATQKAAANGRHETVLAVKARSSEAYKVRCLLGAIPTGIFKTHIVGILYPLDL